VNESRRIEAFSDAVFAIAITLLALDLTVPEPGDFTSTLLDAWPSYLAYLATFLTIASIWIHHHAVFSRIAGVEPAVLLLNVLLLLGVSLLPWPTALIAVALQDGDRADGIAAVLVYAIASLIVGVAWTATCAVLARRPRLLVRESDAAWMGRNARQAALSGLPVLAACGLAFLSTLAALAVFVAIPIAFLWSTSANWSSRN
jgi:uncharacterized membrane protein